LQPVKTTSITTAAAIAGEWKRVSIPWFIFVVLIEDLAIWLWVSAVVFAGGWR
jgi:hypothetical protein